MIGKPLIISNDFEEAWKKYKDYIEKTGLYARVDTIMTEDGPRYRVLAYNEKCNLKRYCNATHMDLRALARTYMRVTKLKVATERMMNFIESETIRVALEEAIREKTGLKKAFAELVERHPVYEWCQRIRAGRAGRMGAVDALMFLGWIDIHEANTAGRAKSIWGLTPEGKKVSGRKFKGRPELKGIAYMMAKRVIMAKDPYYYPLYQAKKEYLLNKYPEKVVVKTKNGPMEFKKGEKGYAAVINGKAMFWLMQLLVSNAQQVIREAEGYIVPKHHPHIEPKPSEDAVPSEEILRAVREGRHWV